MKYIKLFERYSLPDSIESISNELVEIISEKFDEWVMRKSLANWSNRVDFKPSRVFDDFPVNIVKCRLKFLVVKSYNKFTCSGFSSTFSDTESELKPEIVGDKVNIGIQISIFIPYNKKSFKIDEVKEMEDIILHELLHSYQSYKKKILGHKENPEEDIISNSYAGAIDTAYKHKVYTYLNVLYLTSNKSEMNAHLAQTWKKGGDYWLKWFNLLYNMSFEEFMMLSDGVDKEKFYKTFMNTYNSFEEGERQQKILNFKNYEDILKFFWDKFQRNKSYIRKKINKIKYSKHEEILKNNREQR